jgi:hypothetical protein
MPVLRRADVDRAALSEFEQTALDYEATREHVERHLRSGAEDARTQADRAAREAAELRARADRIRRDYRRGKLDADDNRAFRDEVADELAAAEAETARLTARAAEADAALADLDAESETLRRLTELRATVAGRINGARDVPALRAAIAQVFAQFWIVADPFRLGHYGVLPEPRPEMVNALPYDPEMGAHFRPDDYERLRRLPVALDPDYETTSGVPE